MTRVRHRWYKEEAKDLLKSWVVLSLAFAILMTGLKFSVALLINFVISSITVGMGFLLHELAHKFVAQKYGARAVYKANPIMLGVTLVSSLFGFVFAAPGAVYIIGLISKKRNGIISVAGPLTNIALALLFLITMFFSPIVLVKTISSFGLLINAWIGAFNMIPFGPFDGKKIWEWNRMVYVITAVAAVGLILMRFLL